MITEAARRQLRRESSLVKLRAAVCDSAVSVCISAFGDRLRAIVLTGSMARGEATFVWDADQWGVLGDAEFFVVFHERCRLPDAAATESACRHVERVLREQGLRCHIGLSSVHPQYLIKLAPDILAYELKENGKVVWGDSQVLMLIPAFSASDIPLEDAWRLLSNRMVEFLAVVPDLAASPVPLPPTVFYRTVKLYLDMATSYLLFAGAYEPTYTARADRLRSLAIRPSGMTTPFPLRNFAQRVDFCTGFKLQRSSEHFRDSNGLAGDGAATFWKEAVDYAHRLWRWELSKLTRSAEGLSDSELMRQWMRLQPLGLKVRGWASVLRRCGWLRSWHLWPHWARMAAGGSPRYWIYATASKLFFALSNVVGPTGTPKQVNYEELQPLLPLTNRQLYLPTDWPALCAEATANYHIFVETTRA